MKQIKKEVFEDNVVWCEVGEYGFVEKDNVVVGAGNARMVEEDGFDVSYYNPPCNTLSVNKIKVYTKLSDNPEKSNNGGDYYFFHCYYWVEEIGMWEKRYYSSSDFAYCQKHGMHQECRNCMGMGEDGCVDDYEYYTTSEVEEVVGDNYEVVNGVVNERKMIVKEEYND